MRSKKTISYSSLIFVFVVILLILNNFIKKDYNVILISIDTLRADRLGYMGYEKNTSPNIDKLASESVVFSNVVSAASWTLPSHLSIFSSMYPVSIFSPSQEGINAAFPDQVYKTIPTVKELMSNVTLLAEVAKKEGYTTAAFVSGEFVSSVWGFDRGFDTFYEEGLGLFGKQSSDRNLRTIKNMLPVITNWTDNNKDKKFFLFLHFFDVHAPYEPPKEFDVFHSDGESGTENVSARYDGEILYTDHYLGQFFDYLKKNGLYENSIIVITSDHGEELYAHGVNDHSPFLYHTVLHVPLIIKYDGYAPKVIGSQVRSIDIAPTVLNILKIKIPESFQGRDLTPLALGKENAPRIALSVSSPSKTAPYRGYALTSEDGKKIIFERQNNATFFGDSEEPPFHTRLYNLDKDPYEKVNLAGVDPGLVDELKARLAGMVKSISTNRTIRPVTESKDIFATGELRKQGYI